MLNIRIAAALFLLFTCSTTTWANNFQQIWFPGQTRPNKTEPLKEPEVPVIKPVETSEPTAVVPLEPDPVLVEPIEPVSLPVGSPCALYNQVELNGICGHLATCPEIFQTADVNYCAVGTLELIVCCPKKEPTTEEPLLELDTKIGGKRNADLALPTQVRFDQCHLSTISRGDCLYINECKTDLKQRGEPEPKEWTYCHTGTTEELVCCMGFPNVKEDVSAPYLQWKPYENVICGSTDLLPMYVGTVDHIVNHDAYFLNETADRLQSEGFKVEVIKMYGDAIEAFKFSNGSKKFSVSFEGPPNIDVVVGGQDAGRANAYFMALMGEKRDDSIEWVCDGVVLNREWILSAAHCFLETGIQPNIIRLGEYDWSNDENKVGPTYDFGIAEAIFYPEFDSAQRYHDMVLIKLDRPYPMFARNINPVCLPWDNHTNLDIVGRDVTLAGWGAIEFSGAQSAKYGILQSVQLRVFNTSTCDESYSTLLDYRFKWPRGLSKDTMLCAGDMVGGKDACKGDSGAPVTYMNEYDQHMLAGIVSSGFGCGLAEFPGLYIPFNNAAYLKWIKSVAFKGFVDTGGILNSDQECNIIL